MQRYTYFSTTNHEHERKSASVSSNCSKENAVNNESGKFPLSGLEKLVKILEKH
jgi:hypothetical protein